MTARKHADCSRPDCTRGVHSPGQTECWDHRRISVRTVTTADIPTPDWTGAACLDEDPELFFPSGNPTAVELQTLEAKSVCDRCPDEVFTECRTYARQAKLVGIWGGESDEDRVNAARRARRAARA